MKTLSIMQPWAWLIVNGHKDIENRQWQPTNPGLNFRGKFLVHAGKKIDGGKRGYPYFCEDMLDDFNITLPKIEDLQLGGIVGMSEVLDVVHKHNSRWFAGMGSIGLVLGRARTLPFMPFIGQLGFFDVEYDRKLLEQANEQKTQTDSLPLLP